ncbi:hypothetical protein FB451DRAFT_1502771 [Mycena latifolia]|nr:hypothetical protein FB451DRAFT_1502771 [Mycena latifolia]
MESPTPFAFVTLITSDAYLPGALALAGALKDIHPTPAVPPEVDHPRDCRRIDDKLLRRAYNSVVGVEVIAQEDDKGLKLLGRLDLNTVLTKLHVFRLTQYSKIIFLDADVLPIRPLSHLFTLPHEFSAVPDVGWPDIFNSGVLVLSPGEDKFTELNQLLKSKGTWDGGDQGILNEWRGGDWNRLSFIYNTTPTAAYTYAPAYERFGSQISAIHFIGPNKPWNSLSYRPPFQSHGFQTEAGPLQAYDYNALVDRWFAVYDKHCRAQPTVSESEFEVKRYISAWDEQTGTGSELISGSMTSGTALGLEDLRKIAVEGMSAGGTGAGPVEEVEQHPAWIDPGTLSTPSPTSHARSQSPPRWETLPTPGPDEVPPSPRLLPISLPPTPTPASYAQGHEQHDHHHHHQQQQQQQHDQHQHQHQQQQQQHDQHHQHHEQQQQHHHHQEPPRPASPPMLIWNAATDPPPTTKPSASSFPTETYFPNIWDQPPSQPHRQGPRGPSPPPDSDAFFQPPPPTEIPEALRRQGHYRNVTGDEEGATPSPDRSKVKHVFPWEEKPRQMPGRVFPSSDAPSPSLFMSPGTPESVSQPRSQPLSPLHGLPATLTYANAWDTVPSIQKYASRLVRPPQSPVPLAPAFEGGHRHKGRSWEDRTEVSSMDGDDEDDWRRRRRVDGRATARAGRSGQRQRPGNDAELDYGAFAERLVVGIGDILVQGQEKGIYRFDARETAVAPRQPAAVDTERGGRAAARDGSHWPGPIDDDGVADARPATAWLAARIPLRVAYDTDADVDAAAAARRYVRGRAANFERRLADVAPVVDRAVSPPDAVLVLSPTRKGSRVWDPARGVELFKRGSEEVLARFLKMGSWEDEGAH